MIVRPYQDPRIELSDSDVRASARQLLSDFRLARFQPLEIRQILSEAARLAITAINPREGRP